MRIQYKWNDFLKHQVFLKLETHTAQEIAEGLHQENFYPSRNAIIGLCRRMNWALTAHEKNIISRRKTKKQPEKKVFVMTIKKNEVKKETTNNVIKVKEIRKLKPIAFPDKRFLSDGYCRNIIGEPGELKCCGYPTKIGNVYCRFCKGKIFVKTQSKKVSLFV